MWLGTLERRSKQCMKVRFLHRWHTRTKSLLLCSRSLSSQNGGYKGFGSFHSDNVEDLLREASAREYTPPRMPESIQEAISAALEGELHHFGETARAKHFLLSRDFTFLNHGAFGSPCVASHKAAVAWREHAERQPLAFIDRELFAHLVHSISVVAAAVGASPGDLVLVPNATTALNVALNAACSAASVGENDEILLMDVGYGSVRKMAARECTRRGGVKLKTCSLLPLLQSLAMDTNAVVEHVRQSMTPRTRVVVFDHVTSNTALQLPVAKLVRLCREHGVFSVVDGAHSLGSISRLNVEEIGADFFCGNLHKWWCNVRGCGFLHVRADAPELHPCVEPPVVSHGYGEGGMASDFLWQGAGDYAPMLAVTATAEWWGPQGVELAISRNRELLSAAAHLLSGAWQTRTLLPTGSPLSANTMSLVQVPMPRRGAHAHTSADGKALQDALFRRGIECPIKTIDGELYVRISAGVYNQLHEYQRLANEVRKIISKADTPV